MCVLLPCHGRGEGGESIITTSLERFLFLPSLQTGQHSAHQLKSQENLSSVKFPLLLFSKSYLFTQDDFWELICLSTMTVSDLSEAGKEGKPLQ